jgi:hypothetical protein
MSRVEYFDEERNEWVVYSTPVNKDYASIHFETIKNRGDSVRVIEEGKITQQYLKGDKDERALAKKAKS